MSRLHSPRKLSLLGLFSATCALAGAGTLISFLGWFHWLPELFTHFRVQYAVTLMLGSALFAAVRQFRPAVIFLSLAAPNVLLIVAAGIHQAPRDRSAAPALTVLSLNVLTSNLEHGRALALVRESAADVVVLSEVDGQWANAIATLSDEWPHMLIEPREDNFGIALLSRSPLIEPEIIELADAEVPAVRASIRTMRGRFVIYGVHLLPPSSPEYARMRDGQMSGLARLVREHPDPVVVVGDFNATPWSPSWRRFVSESRLRTSLVGYGLRGTWPNGLPLLSIPLDHIFVSDSVRIVTHRIGREVGSDHRPVIVTLAIH